MLEDSIYSSTSRYETIRTNGSFVYKCSKDSMNSRIVCYTTSRFICCGIHWNDCVEDTWLYSFTWRRNRSSENLRYLGNFFLIDHHDSPLTQDFWIFLRLLWGYYLTATGGNNELLPQKIYRNSLSRKNEVLQLYFE